MSKIIITKNDFQVFWEATIRYYELDPQGVMHNANHVAFFDQAITAYFKHVNYDYLKDIEETKKDFHTVQVLVQYNIPLYFDQEIEIGVKIKEIGNSSMTWMMGMFLKETDDLVSSCEAVHVYTDQTTMKATPITEKLKEKLNFK
tara:strand:+ start:64 stop:498 length:435 start_codon:yes stop_codon:yes gene_type:complete